MKTETLSTRIDADTKQAFTQICHEIGLSASQAMALFTKAVINHGGIPFELRIKQPNKETIAAMEQLEAGKGHSADSVEQLFEQLGVDSDSNV